jgi:aerobic C4-dicarboxylate transport protein
VVALVAGIIISNLSKRESIINKLNQASSFVFKILKLVMYLAPIGAFGGMAFAVGKFGIASLLPLAKLLGCVYVTMAIFIFIVIGTIIRNNGL